MCAFALCICTFGQTTVSGTVKDADGDALIGATVRIKGTNQGGNTDSNGAFSFTTDANTPMTLTVSYIGYATSEVEYTGAGAGLNVTLTEATILGDEVIISASRRPEKVQEAPASISVINAKKLSVSPQIDPTRNLISTPGVQISQQSANRINIEMRAASGLFGTSVFPIMDYRSLVGPGIGTFQTDNSGINTIDLQRIEVVRGPGSALYGPGVVSGVIHFITKNPIDFPGTTIEVNGGSLNTVGGAIRHAGRSANKKFGYKINAHYRRGDEFTLDPVEDADQIARLQSTISQPQITNGVVDVTKPLEQLLGPEETDEDGDGNPMQNDWFNTSINATLEFRPQDDLSIFASGGFNQASSVFYNSQGEGLAQAQEVWTQARVQKGGLFAQFFYVDNTGGSKERPTFLYQTGLRTPVARQQVEGQLQYNFDIPSFLNANITVGSDYRLALNDTENLVYGRNEDDDDYQIFGAYAQGKFALGDKLDMVLAGRWDTFNFLENENAFSPRIAFVFKPSPKHTFRASYNRAAAPPSGLQVNIDFPVAAPVPGLFDIWLAGQKSAHEYPDGGTIDLTAPGLPDLPFGTPGMPLAIPYGAVNSAVLAQLIPGLEANPQTAPLAPAINAFLQGYSPTGTSGNFIPYNIFTGEAMPTLDPTLPARLNIIDAFEVGYKGLITDKLSLSVDIYNQAVTGFTLFTAVAPTINYAGIDQLAGDLGSNVEAAILAHLVDITGLPEAALAPVAAAVGGAYTAGGQGFADAVSPLGAIFGAVESNRVPQDDGITHVSAGYRTFADAKRDWWGSDIGLEFYASEDLTFWGNYSWVSQNSWIPGEDNDDGLPSRFDLNTPQNKFRLGANYTPATGFNASVSFQHDDSFYANFGQFAGDTEPRNLVDAAVGYAFDNGLSLNLAATNLFNNKYRAFPNFPQIGNRTILTLRYTFGDDQ